MIVSDDTPHHQFRTLEMKQSEAVSMYRDSQCEAAILLYVVRPQRDMWFLSLAASRQGKAST
jgi:hypothetical protein